MWRKWEENTNIRFSTVCVYSDDSGFLYDDDDDVLFTFDNYGDLQEFFEDSLGNMKTKEELDEIFGDTYLYTKKFADDLMVFWKDKGQGYTRDIDLAGVWPLSEALKIAKSAGDHVVPILKSDLEAKLKIQRVINKEHSDNFESVQHLEKLVSVYSKRYDDLDKDEQ